MKLNQESRNKLHKMVVAEIDKAKHQLDSHLTEDEKLAIVKKETKLQALVDEYNKITKRGQEIKELFKKNEHFDLSTGWNGQKAHLTIKFSHPLYRKRREETELKRDKMEKLKITTFTKIFEMEKDYDEIFTFIKEQISKF